MIASILRDAPLTPISPEELGTGSRQPLDPTPIPSPSQQRWKRIGTMASAALFALSLVVLVFIVRELDAAEIKAAIAAASMQQLLFALGMTALSYLLLTGYDALGFLQLKIKAPYRITALGSFTSYAVSFTLGFPLITAGTVRYWIYSSIGISARVIASLTLIAGVTFWLGMATVLGLFLLARPSDIAALNRFPISLNMALGAAILGGVVGYLTWVARKRRSLRFQGWTLELPGFRLSLAQLALGALDVCAAGAALYILLPQGYGISFGAFIAAYVFACILGIASHAPGGIGVFEATILLALPGIPTEQLLGSLLLFRLIYYILPFVIALSLLGGREIWLRGSRLRTDMAEVDRAEAVSADRNRNADT